MPKQQITTVTNPDGIGKPMTVASLIRILTKLPQEAIMEMLTYADEAEGYVGAEAFVESVQFYHADNTVALCGIDPQLDEPDDDEEEEDEFQNDENIPYEGVEPSQEMLDSLLAAGIEMRARAQFFDEPDGEADHTFDARVCKVG